MIPLPYTRRWYLRRVLQRTYYCHTLYDSLFGVAVLGMGTYRLAKSSFTAKLRRFTDEIQRAIPRCGWPEDFAKDLSEFWHAADDFVLLVDETRDNDTETAKAAGDRAATYLQIMPFAAWHLVTSTSDEKGSSDSPLAHFQSWLKTSTVRAFWVEGDLAATNRRLRQALMNLGDASSDEALQADLSWTLQNARSDGRDTLAAQVRFLVEKVQGFWAEVAPQVTKPEADLAQLSCSPSWRKVWFGILELELYRQDEVQTKDPAVAQMMLQLVATARRVAEGGPPVVEAQIFHRAMERAFQNVALALDKDRDAESQA